MPRNGVEKLRKKVTLRDVATVAEVSMSTASKALNDRPGEVSASTRDHVRDVAERLGFTPNAIARAMLSGRTGTVGLLTDDLEGRFSLPILMGAEDAFGAGQTSVLLCDARGDAIREQHHVRALMGRNVDGLIVVGSRPDPRPSWAGRVSVPVVHAYAPSQDAADLSVVTDNRRAGELAAEHLLSVGRRRIAHISGDQTYMAAQGRAEGVRAVLEAEGLELVAPPQFGAWTERWGRAATQTLLAERPDVDAIVGGSDQISRGILDALHDEGRRVPVDVALVSFDNWKPLIVDAPTPLTSVDLGFTSIGRRAAEMLSSVLDGRPPEESVEYVQPRLVVRESSAGS
ncbi:LacI family DNA-binding transcriptional regulator [Nesterenkonia sp. F]|uniref:LacI family DNA-binding transcriptional regulator n=1 Tax=Nesterenkonia sp. F TaxID=795955 RepID=UPI000255D072|nr:LacI family DNA-binding transcriptional regulator [Nesterenkonia sp. F]